MKGKLLLIFMVILCLIPQIVIADTTYTNVRTYIGETWIKVSWGGDITTQVYIDGRILLDDLSMIPIAQNISVGYVQISGLPANSPHNIRLINASNINDYKDITNIKTLSPVAITQILFVICIILSVALLIYKDVFINAVLIGIFNGLLSLYGRTISYGLYGIDLLFMGFVIWSIILVIYAFVKTYRSDMAWY